MKITTILRGGGLLLTATSSILSGFLITRAHAVVPEGTYAQCTGGPTSCLTDKYASGGTKAVMCCCRVDPSHWLRCQIIIEYFVLRSAPNDPSQNRYRFVSKTMMSEPCVPYTQPIDPALAVSGARGRSSCSL